MFNKLILQQQEQHNWANTSKNNTSIEQTHTKKSTGKKYWLTPFTNSSQVLEIVWHTRLKYKSKFTICLIIILLFNGRSFIDSKIWTEKKFY